METFKRILREEHLEILRSINKFILVLESKGRYKEAELLYWRALEGKEEVLGLLKTLIKTVRENFSKGNS